MKTIWVLIMLTILVGCSEVVSKTEWDWADGICEKNGGAVSFNDHGAMILDRFRATCADGATFKADTL